MKSLHHFMAEKGLDFAVRCNISQPSLKDIRVKTTSGIPVSYRLLSIPVYLTERIGDLIDMAQESPVEGSIKVNPLSHAPVRSVLPGRF